MMLKNGVEETTTTTGTGTVTLSAVTARVRFSQAFAVGALANYAIKDGDNYEWGLGTVGAANTLARTRILATLVAGTYTEIGATAITLSGSATVFCSSLASALLQSCPGSESGYITSGHNSWSDTLYTFSMNDAQITYVPFLLHHAMTVTGAGAYVTTAGGTNMRVGIYGVTPGGQVGALLGQSGDLSPATTGLKSAAFTGGSIRLSPGWYFMAVGMRGSSSIMASSEYNFLCGPWGMASSMAHYSSASYNDWGWTVLAANGNTGATKAGASRSPRLFLTVS